MRFPLALFILAACDPTSPDKADVNDSLPVVSEEPDADNDGYSEADGDCDDDDAARYPGAPDDCDGVDNDCDYETDEDAVWSTWYPDQDKDGYGDQARGEAACAPPEGAVADGTDCNDHNAAVNSDVAEVCNGMDDDCDGEVDEDGATGEASWYADVDGDGFGDPYDGLASCVAPDGYLADATDCDDGDEEVNPTALELCDGVDNDCNGEVDEDSAVDAQEWYEDGDGDGFGNEHYAKWSCYYPSGYVGDPSDCDDSMHSVNPDTYEMCNGIDDDCDMTVDEADSLDAVTFYPDKDGDGYGDSAGASSFCSSPSGWITLEGDCVDTDETILPGAEEYTNGVDDDCDLSIDEINFENDVLASSEALWRATSVTSKNCFSTAEYTLSTYDFTTTLTARVVRIYDATHPAASTSDIIAAVNDANRQLSEGGISLSLIWDSPWESSTYALFKSGADWEALRNDYISTHSVDTTAIYIFVTSANLGSLLGIATFPADPNPIGVLLNGESLTVTGLLAHELGHYFNQLHTFQGTESGGGAAELVSRTTGANCSAAGDYACETDADPGRFDLGDLRGCPYDCHSDTFGPCVGADSSGASFAPYLFSGPHEYEVMSYYFCDAQNMAFSSEQADRLRCSIINDRANLARDVDHDSDGYTSGDCDDERKDVHPGAQDGCDSAGSNCSCDGVDNDCDGDPDDDWDESQDSDGQSECDGDCDDDDGDTYDSFKHAFRYTGSSDNWITGFGTTLQTPLLGDVDNDGMADAVGFYADGDWYVALATSYSGSGHDAKGDYFATESRWIEGFGDGSTEQFLADVNGDFRQDAVIFRGDTGVWGVALSSGSAFVSMSNWVSDSGADRGHGELSDHVMMGDVNGDGMSDIVSFYRNNGESYSNDTDGDGVADADGDLTADNEWWVAYSTGADFGNGVDGSSAGYHLWIAGFGSDSVAEFVADVDGDGCADAVIMESDGDWRYISGGCGSPSSAKVLMAGSSGERADLILMGDVDGDGLSDAGAFYVSSNDGDLVDVNGYIGATLDTDGDGIDDHDAAGLSAVMKVGLNNWGTLDSDFLSQYWIEDFGADANRVFLVNVDETYADPMLADLVAFYASTGTWKVARAVGWECSDEED